MKTGKNGLFPQLVDALRKWTTRNPKKISSHEKGFKRENAYQANYKIHKHPDVFIVRNMGIKPMTLKQ